MKRDYELKAGSFLGLALILFIAGIWLLGQERHIFSRQVEYFSDFVDVKGLAQGAPVRLAGITVGRVSNIDFLDNVREAKVQVTLLINLEYMERVREDAIATIQTQGLLGDKFISLSSGKSAENAKPGSMLKNQEPSSIAEVLEKAGEVVNTTVEISTNINEFLKELRTGTLQGITDSAANIADISDQIKNGKGLINRLVYSEEEGNKIITNLEDATANIKKTTEEIREGEGLLHALIYDKQGKESVQSLLTTVRNLAQAAEHINNISKEIESGDGVLHELVYNSSSKDVEKIISKLSTTAANLQKASEALAEGSGTIGALLVDSQLYDNLVEVTDGAKRSMILRHAIRNSLKEN